MREEDFKPLPRWEPTPLEIERRRRIQLSVATYAYELADSPIMSDDAWDRIAQRINKSLGTGHPLLDEFFASEFSPMTGMWIRSHPELDSVKNIFTRYWRATSDHYEGLYKYRKLTRPSRRKA